jgi:putative inorganic carbon (HCO3(-)) transporter
LALLLPVTLLATPLPEITRPQVYRLLLGLGLCYAIINHTWGLVGVRRVMIGFVALAAGMAMAALVSVDWFADKMTFIPVDLLSNLPRLISGQVHPNVMAGTLVLLALFGPAWLLFSRREMRWPARVFLLLATAFTIIVLIFTKSRGAWLGLAAGLAVLVILRWPRWGTAAVVIVCLAAGGILAARADLVQSLMKGYDSGSDFSGLQGRLDIWKRAVTQIEAFPLTGMGMGTFAQVSRALYPSSLVITGDNPHAHNLFLQIAVDLGLPGLAAWLVMVLVVARCAWQVYRAGIRQSGWLAGLGAGLLAAQAVLAVHGVVDAVTWGTRPAIVVWGIWGLALAGWVLVRCEPPYGNLPPVHSPEE